MKQIPYTEPFCLMVTHRRVTISLCSQLISGLGLILTSGSKAELQV